MTPQDPLFLLALAVVPSAVVAWFTLRGLTYKESLGARGAESTRIDAQMRSLIDMTLADNMRLRRDEAERNALVAEFMALARLWYEKALDERYGRKRDREASDGRCNEVNIRPVDWQPLVDLPSFEAIDD